ncbi:MAG TPA: TetR family transcriptional regulator C-terminal domain-containing protein [Deltaproteobacteria bacterium]|jgi:TetR/AcrR family transcriptional repressor of nem operon|nr:TetR family transcriptional regulator C-terminal domain-containing protein [Deltaproteobacteria bacterium]HOI06963.1 TetR family transcriptional regulator C-terminal domain-containing protein [Deltaproteobacteria bacterium]
MPKEDTRLAIIREGARLIHTKGFNNTGLSDILKAAGVPKGSFYFYFKNKEAFGLAVIDHFADAIVNVGEKFLLNKDYPPLERLNRFLDFFQKAFQAADMQGGCPVGNLTQEMSDLSESFRGKIAEVYSRITSLIAGCLEEARELGDVSRSLDARKTAEFIFNSWEGSIMHMKLTKNLQPLFTCRDMIYSFILKKDAE